MQIFQKLLMQVARHAGFSPYTGLFNGKMGTAILLYHGARYLELPELYRVAGSLIDDILEEPLEVGYSFKNGLSGIAWGIHYLMLNGFIEPESNFFDDLDNLLFKNNASVLKYDLFQYPLTGLYIHTRLADSPGAPFFNEQALDYCKYMLKQLDAFEKVPYLLIPFLYCTWQWSNKKFIDSNYGMEICRKLSYLEEIPVKNYQSSVLLQLYNNLCGKRETFAVGKLTFTAVKILFFYKLLYQNLTLPPWNLLHNSFEEILADNILTEELLLLCNHRNQGLVQNISGFTWALFQYLNYSMPRKDKYLNTDYHAKISTLQTTRCHGLRPYLPADGGQILRQKLQSAVFAQPVLHYPGRSFHARY